jgi:hypothetical protein
VSDTHAFDAMLNAAVRALDELVAPGLDPANPLAQEQLRLVLRFLGLIRQRAGHEHRRQRAELAMALAQVQALQAAAAPWPAVLPGEVHARLVAALADGRSAFADADAEDAALQQAAQALDALAATIVRFAPAMPEAQRLAVERQVLAGAQPLLALRRAWFSPLGLDPEPASVPDFRQALQAALQATHLTR